MPDYTALWDQYDLAVDALYDELGTAQAQAVPVVRSADLLSRADLVVSMSSRLANLAESGLAASHAFEREEAMLQLVAGAAADLAVVTDLMRVEGDVFAVEARSVAGNSYIDLMAELGPLVRHELTTITTRGVTTEPPPTDVEEAVALLTAASGRTFEVISGDVIYVGQIAINGLVALPVAQLQRAAGLVAQEILNLVTQNMGDIASRAVSLLVQAYDKILKALGKEGADQARQRAAEWVVMLRSGKTLASFLELVYDKERILDDIEAYARQMANVLLTRAHAQTLTETRALAEKFERHRKALEWVLHGLGIVKSGLLTFEPWGPLTVAGLYVGTLGYTVYAGGDYVDWFRTDRIQPLNHVPGLRDVVRKSLKLPDSEDELAG